MPKITQLSPHEAQKIAAGEVVERPANVVKELLENSLDAGATAITIHIEEAGKKLIQVIDNGSGMDYEDARLCFGQHATSKIKVVEELESLTTFGFRGEALSSIAAVSKVQLITKESNAEQGIHLSLSEGKICHEKFVSSNPGTTITVENIFYNLPVRKKFLKTNETEWRQIAVLFQAFCLDYLPVHFKLFHNGTLVYNCPPTEDFLTRLAQVWDHTFAHAMLPFQATQGALSVKGALSHQHYMRYDRSHIFFFVNNRWIKNQHLSRALLKGYLNVLPPGRFPAAFIFITVDPHEIDINIHPRKEEAQFLHPRIIEKFIQETVKKTLENKITTNIQRQESSAKTFINEKTAPVTIIQESAIPAPFSPLSSTASFSAHPPVQQFQLQLQEEAFQKSIPTKHNDEVGLWQPSYKLIGQLHKTYLLIEHEEGLFLVDQHAAHERILYEQFRQRFGDVASTQLLFPTIVTLSKDDIRTLEPYLPFLGEQGITAELFGEQQIIIYAAPIPLKDVALDNLMQLFVGWAKEHAHLEKSEVTKLITERLHAQMACKAAVKAGDVLSTAAMEELLGNLQKTDNRFTCPHGRPTGWLITSYEIEKKFKRKL
jgi:DNA mismatch repair protein MutL